MPRNNASQIPVEIIFYHKDDCHLCNDMVVKLNDFLSDLDQKFTVVVTMRDIDDDSEWFKRYREYVPVLVIGKEEVCYYFFDETELMLVLSTMAK